MIKKFPDTKVRKQYKIGLLGNPNVGKSSIINKLAKNLNLKTGNWSGVTVSKKTVRIYKNNNLYDFTDLPGIYSFVSPNAAEEIAINELLSSDYDLFVQVLDGTDLQNSLYLTLLLKELNINFVMLVNFSDRLKDKSINMAQLQLILKKHAMLINIYENNAAQKLFKLVENYLTEQNEKIEHKSRCIPNIERFTLLEKYHSRIAHKTYSVDRISRPFLNFYWYNEILNQKYQAVQKIISNARIKAGYHGKVHRLILAQGALDNNQYILQKYKIESEIQHKLQIINTSKKYSTASFQHLKSERDKYISAIFHRCIQSNHVKKNWINHQVWIDNLLLNRVLAVPMLLSIIFCLFVLVFNFTTPYKNFISSFFVYYLPSFLHLLNNHHWYASLLTNGVFNSLGTMASFFPVMYLLFIMLHYIEQSGVIARVSFLLDGFFSRFGMNGKSIIPLILGFGCNVGSIYATRTIANPTEKKITAMISPFISCSARLVVFALFTSIFFNTFGGLIIFSLYLLGVFVAFSLAFGFAFVHKLVHGKSETQADKLYDLPKYKIPKFLLIIRLTNFSVKNYSKRVFKIILLFTLFIWVVNTIQIHQHSILFYFGYVLTPIFKPLGFGRAWILCVSLIPGIIAKETTVATLALLFGISASAAVGSHIQTGTFHNLLSDSLSTIKNGFVNLLPNHWFSASSYGITSHSTLSSNISKMLRNIYPSTSTTLIAYAYMCFILLSIPCVTTLSAIRHEYGWKAMIQSAVLGITTPYIITLIIFQSVNYILIHK